MNVIAIAFDVAFFLLSISALQWLCNADKKDHHPVKRLNKFFSTLYMALVRRRACFDGSANFLYIVGRFLRG